MIGAPTGTLPYPPGHRRAPLGASAAPIIVEKGVSKFAAYLVAGVIFLNLTRLASLYRFLEALEIPLLLTGFAALVMFSEASKWKPADLGKHWIPWLIVVVLFFGFAGIPTALHRNATFTYLTHGFSQSILGGVMVFGVARTAAGRRFMAQTLCVSGVVTAWLALIWNRQDNAYRLAGAATYDSNDLALIVVITMPMLIWWFFDNKSKIRWFAILAMPMMFTVMLRTSSRGGFLGMVAIVAGLLFIGSTGRVREMRKIALTSIFLALIGVIAMPGAYLNRMRTMDSELDNKSPRARINVWKRGIGYAVDNPILGVGMVNFGRAEGILSDYSQERAGIGVKWSTAHSSYIQAWAEIGFIGGGAFTIAIIGGMISLLMWRPPPWMRDPAQRMLTPMVGLSTLAFAVSGAFLSFAFDSPPYYLLGFGTALLLASRAVPAGALPSARAQPGDGSKSLSRTAAPPRPPLSRYPAPPPRLWTPRRNA